MGQETITVDVPFGKGINEKLDPKILPNGILETCENAIFDKLGSIHKRNGLTAMNNAVLGTGTLSTVARLASYQGALLAIDGHFLYSYDQQNTIWVNRGQVPEAYVTADAVARELNGVASWPVVGENAGIRVIAWQSNITLSGTIIVAHVIDSATGTLLFESQLNVPSLVTVRSRPMVVTIGQYIWVIYASGTNIVGNRLDTSSPTAFGAPVTITANYAGAAPLDAAPLDSNNFLIAYFDVSVGNRICTALVNAAGTITSSAFIAEAPNNSIAVMGTSGENVYVAWHSNANGVRVAGYTTALGVSFAATTILGTLVPIADQITLCRLTSTSAMVVWREKETATLRCFTRMRSVSNAGALLGVLQSTYTIGIVSKPFVYDSHMYVLTCNSGTTGTASRQPTYFLVDLGISDVASANKQLRVVGSAYESVAVARPAQGVCPVANPSTGKFILVGAIKSRATSDYGDLVVQLTLDMASGLRWQSAEFGENAVFAGGVPMGFDGTGCFELGFHLYPELCTATPAGGGALTAGTYSVAIVYEWIDARGQRIQSVPCILPGIVSGAAGKITVTAPNLNITTKSDLAGARVRHVAIAAYLTDVGGTTHFRQPTTTGVVVNDPTSSTDVTIVITATNNTGEQLYTTGGVLENAALPPTTTLAVHQNRLWFVSGEDSRAIRYSKEFTVGVSPEFNEGLEFRIDKGGDVTAVASMDGRLVAFKAETTFAIGGQGATDTGVGDSLGADEIHSDALGAIDPRGVTKLPDGLLYQAKKGLYKLDRSLTSTYLGANVENEVTSVVTIVAAAAIDNGRRVILCARESTGGTCKFLVFDTLVGEWSVWLPILSTTTTPTNAADYPDVFSLNGQLLFATRSGQSLIHGPIFLYDTASFTDDGNNRFALHWKTGPMRLNGQQNRMRVRRVRFLNTWKSTHALGFLYYRDYSASGVINSFAAGATANGQISFSPAVQVCETFAVEASDDGDGESYSIAGLQLEVSPIRGAFKLPASARL